MSKSTLKRTVCAMLSAFMLIPMLNMGIIPVYVEEASDAETSAETEAVTEAETEAETEDETEDETETEAEAEAETEAETEPAADTETPDEEEETAAPKPVITGTSSFVGGSYTHEGTTIATSLYVPKDYSADKEYALLHLLP